jgi:hypothetical protein
MRFAGVALVSRSGPGEVPCCNRGCRKQERERTIQPLFAVILNLTSFGLVVLAVLALLLTVTVLHRAPTRPCHRCGRRVRLDKRVCRHCGYVFEPVRFGR